MKKVTLEMNEEQARLVQDALDFYSRVGIGQMDRILDHPTYQKYLAKKLRPKKSFEVGDETERGNIVEIGEGFIRTEGHWNGQLETRTWTDVENINHSIDYSFYHEIRKKAEKTLNLGRNQLLCEEIADNSYWGIHNPDADKSCRDAFDLMQVIRHGFWKTQPDRPENTVSSRVNFIDGSNSNFKCQIHEEDGE
jgi:hypothetical protein